LPSVILGNPLASGGQQLISGNPWSGQSLEPVGGIQLKLDKTASGNAYICLSGAGIHPGSGGQTLGSGGMFLSGFLSSGLMDGVQIGPGEGYFIPALVVKRQLSGNIQIGALVDQAGSGQARLYWEAF
jgi:hypothetical protein